LERGITLGSVLFGEGYHIRECIVWRGVSHLGVHCLERQVEITNRFAALENLNEDEDVNRIWGNIKHNIQTSTKESLCMHDWKQHKPWFDEKCVGFLDQRKRAKMQLVQNPCQSNVDNLNSVRREVSRHFRKKKERIFER